MDCMVLGREIFSRFSQQKKTFSVGSVSQLVFYSARGMQRMQDLTGKGPDEDPCGSHKKK